MSIYGNLLLELRKMSHNDKLTGGDLLKRENFEHLTNAIKNMSKNENGYLKPGLKLAIGYLLK